MAAAVTVAPPALPRPTPAAPPPHMAPPPPPGPSARELAAPVPPWLDALVDLVAARAALDCAAAPRAAPPTAARLAELAAATSGLPRIRHALHILRTPGPPGVDALAARDDAPRSLVAMIADPDRLFCSPPDTAAVLVATHSLCSNKPFRDNFVAARGLHALCALLQPPDPAAPAPADRVVGTGVFAVAERNASMHRFTSSSESDASFSALDPSAPAHAHIPAAPIHRAVWNAAIRTIAKLMVCSAAACALSIDTGALVLLARAAAPAQPMDIRLRAAAGLAAIAAWSGPRRAVEIVQTDAVVLSMTAILTERDDRIPGDLRSATIDGLVVMSFRRHARRILQKYGCEEKIKAAARHATVSGDYTAAARSTVAAGQLTGRSIDEYGFLVQDAPSDPADDKPDAFPSAPQRASEPLPTSDDPDSVKRRPTGLRHIQQQLLDEPYTSVEDLNVLEEIVHEEAGVLSSSPRDRHYIRRAARSYGVSVDEIEFISVLEDDSSPQNDEEANQNHTPEAAAAARKLSGGHSCSGQKVALQPSVFAEARESGRSSAQSSGIPSESRKSDRPSSGLSTTLTELAEQAGSSSPRRSSNFMSLQDPDFDRVLQDADDAETASSTTGASSKSKMVSPLLMFSSATKKAAERDGHNNLLQKTNSQLTRETEHERIWRDVMERRPEMLERERGRSSRVVAYRELALVPVPPSLRRRLWPILLDTASLREARPGLYKKLCKAASQTTLPDDIEHTIEADVTRTMPLHSLFWAGGAQVGVQSLRSILRAYARYVPEVGYCQGMSSIAAVFLMNATDEEDAFLMMAQFMTRFQYKKVFAPGFPLMLQWISELKPLVAHYMPELNARLERENVALELYADKWLITALSHNFPHRYLLRVWDLMFLGGSPKIILKACLAVLKKCEPNLMTMNFETMMPFLQRGFAEPEAGVLDAKNPEPFITLTREFRFMPDIPKSQLRGAAQTQANAQASGNERRERRGGSCLPCFRRSATVE